MPGCSSSKIALTESSCAPASVLNPPWMPFKAGLEHSSPRTQAAPEVPLQLGKRRNLRGTALRDAQHQHSQIISSGAAQGWRSHHGTEPGTSIWQEEGRTACQAASGCSDRQRGRGEKLFEGKKKGKKKRGAIFVSWSGFSPTQLTPLVQALSYQIGAAAGRAMPKERL